jgi:hypothetical protein
VNTALSQASAAGNSTQNYFYFITGLSRWRNSITFVAVIKTGKMNRTRLNPLNDFLFMKYMGEKGDEEQLLVAPGDNHQHH